MRKAARQTGLTGEVKNSTFPKVKRKKGLFLGMKSVLPEGGSQENTMIKLFDLYFASLEPEVQLSHSNITKNHFR
jgi:hypothetical protein